jgi:eukaryotic-like serine/threonine-protein kinase
MVKQDVSWAVGEPESGRTRIDTFAEAPTSRKVLSSREVPIAERRRELRNGELLANRWRIVRPLGAGGMGLVYEATDEQLRHSVALKTLQDVGHEALASLKEEFRALPGVVHDNLVGLRDLVISDDACFFTMDLVAGVDFIEHVRADSVRLTALRNGLAQLARGISAIHEAGMIHNDLKPQNVLVDGQGRVVILDFGLSAARDAVRRRRGFAGTPQFMAPELFAGAVATPASDWYAFGVILFEALTGALPFQGRDGLLQKTRQEAPAASALVAGVPADLDALCASLLRRDPLRRPDAASILSALGAHGDLASSAKTVSPRESFVGREIESEALWNAYRTMLEDRTPTVLFVSGDSGIGKTTLVSRFLQQLRSHALVLTGRCHARESIPFNVFDEVIDALAAQLTAIDPVLVAGIADDVATLARSFRSLEGMGSDPAVSRQSDVKNGFEDRKRAGAALQRILRTLTSDQPVVIWVDDVQWGDADSASLLRDLLAGPEAPTLFWIGTHRSEASPFLQQVSGYAQTLIGTDVRRLQVGPLGPHEADRLASAVMPGATAMAVAAVAEQAGGNPFFIRELARGERSLPSDAAAPSLAQLVVLDEHVLKRKQQLRSEASLVLDLVCVAGRPVELTVLVQATALGAVADTASRSLTAARLARHSVRRGTACLEPYHDRVREPIVRALDEATRRALHERLSDAIIALGMDVPEALVGHLEAAGKRAEAYQHALVCAARAMSSLAFERAAALFARCVSLCVGSDAERRELLERRAVALSLAGRGSTAARIYEDLASTADADDAAALNERAGQQYLASGHGQKGFELYRKALSSYGLVLPEERADALAQGMKLFAELFQRPISDEYIAPAEIDSVRAKRVDLLLKVGPLATSLDHERQIHSSALFIREALELGEPKRAAFGLASLATYAGVLMPAAPLAQALLAAAERVHRANPDETLGAWLDCSWGVVQTALQQFTACTVSMQRAYETFRRVGAWEFMPVVCFYHATALGNAGRWNDAWALHTDLIRDAEQREDEALLFMIMSSGWVPLVVLDDPAHVLGNANRVLAAGKGHAKAQSLLVKSECECYAGDAGRAWRTLNESWHFIEDSFFTVEGNKWFTEWLRARLATHLAFLPGRYEEAAEAARSAFSNGDVHPAIEAGLTLAAGDYAGYLERLETIAAGEPSPERFAPVWTARRQLGALIGAERGQALVVEADRALRAMGVRNPARFSRYHTYGPETAPRSSS